MQQTVMPPGGERPFYRKADCPEHFRCFSKSALVDAVAQTRGTGLVPFEAADERIALAYSEGMPMQGEQEILFFSSDLGLVTSDVTYDREFDYDFVFENLSFIQFRFEGRSFEDAGTDEALLVHRPGFSVSSAPTGHEKRSRMLLSEPWRTVTPFFGWEAAERLLEEEEGDLQQAAHAFRRWQARHAQVNHPLTPAMSDAAHAVRTCRFTGPLRRAFLEAKTVELLCLAIAFINDGISDRQDVPLSRRDQARLDDARDIMDRHFANPPTLSVLSRMAGLNRRKLTSGFRSRFGTTVLKYCVDRRMSHARELLEGGEAIADVAEKVGYADQTSFSRAFRQFHGRPPKYFQPQP